MQYNRAKNGKDGRERSETRFDSFAEFMDYIEKMPDTSLGKLSSRKDYDSEGDDDDYGSKKDCWHGTHNFGDAMKLAREGWAEGVEMIEKLAAGLETMTGEMVRKPEILWDVQGDFADAGLYATGVPECMGSFTEVEIVDGKGKIVKILMNLSVSYGVDTKTIMRRGAAAAALIDALETAGRSCELEIAAGSEGGNKEMMTIVPVKHAGEPLELDRLAFLLAHPSSFRRLFFSAWEHEPKDIRHAIGIKPGHGYGSCLNHADEKATVVVPTLDLRTHPTDESLLEWVKSELKKQGCYVDGDEALAAD